MRALAITSHCGNQLTCIIGRNCDGFDDGQPTRWGGGNLNIVWRAGHRIPKSTDIFFNASCVCVATNGSDGSSFPFPTSVHSSSVYVVFRRQSKSSASVQPRLSYAFFAKGAFAPLERL